MLAALKRSFRRLDDALSIETQRLVNRVRHEKLRRRVVEQLAASVRPRRIVVVCNANLCRSPYLEAVLRRNLSDVEVASAGILGAGRRVQPDSLAAALDRGVELSAHRSQLLSRALVERADLVVVMEARQARLLMRTFGLPQQRIVIAGDLDPDADEPRMIIDPSGGDAAAYARTFARLERCALQLMLLLPPADAGGV
jgi:protein-tyrosine phosphatase